MASKIGKSEWKILYAVTGIIDVIQIIIDFVPPIGEAINEVADIFIGIILAVYFQLRGVSMITKISRLLSLVGAEVATELTGGLAPVWIIDVWYIQKSVAQEENEAIPEIPKGITPPRLQRQPVNKTPGIRLPRKM